MQIKTVYSNEGKLDSIYLNRGGIEDAAWASLPFNPTTKIFTPTNELEFQLLAEAQSLPEWKTLDLSDRAPKPIAEPTPSDPDYIPRTKLGVPGGVATLDSENGKLAKKEMPLQTAVEVVYTPPANNIIGNPNNPQTAIDMILAMLTEHQAKVSMLLAMTKSPVVQDALNDLDLVRLSLHIPNIFKGQRWVEEVGIWTISGNQTKSNGTVGSLARIESTLSNCIIECDVTLADVAVPQALVLRFNPTNKSHLRAGFVKSGGAKKFAIYEVAGTSSNIRASTSCDALFGQPYRFKVICQDNAIAFYVDNQLQLSWNSTLNADQTNHGLYCSSSNQTLFNNFLVTPF